mgnify:CR=1 FL=1
MKDIALLDKMYAVNLTYFKELSMYILAGKKKLEEVRTGELAAAVAKAEASNLPEDAQAAKDLRSMCDRFEKKIQRSGADTNDLHSDCTADPYGTE